MKFKTIGELLKYTKNIIKNLDNKMLYGVSSIYPYINFTVQKSGFSIINYINKYGLYFRNIAKKSLGKFLSPINYSVAQGITIGDKSIIPKNINQYFAVLTNLKSVGVMGDERTYEHPVALRAVTSTDAMTADWAHLPYDFMAKVSNDIINHVKGVNRVCYDISSKPPSTIEWE